MSLAILLMPALALAAALPAFPSFGLPTCGIYSDNTNSCANVTEALKGGYSYYQAKPGYFTFAQCHEKCLTDSKCESFQYYYYVDSGFGYTECYLYSLPTSGYTTNDCSAGGTQSLDTFYDEICPPLIPDTQGESPSTCVDSYCYPLGTMKEPNFYRDQLGSAFNVSNAQCKQMCKETPLCKSVYWQYFASEADIPYDSTQEQFGPQNPSDCIFLSQPVQDLIETDGLQSVPLYDLLCPDTEYGYIIKAPFCANGSTPHSSV